MLRLRCLAATIMVALTAGYANAQTFDVSSGTALSGSINFDGTLLPPAFTSALLNVSGFGTFDIIVNSSPYSTLDNTVLNLNGWELDVANSSLNHQTSILFTFTRVVLDSLTGFTGGNITTWFVQNYPCSNANGCNNGLPQGEGGTILAVSTDLGSTPLPAALPLFASGLGALGLLGSRRKRKNAAITA
jgi:hypothetical protein